MRGIYNDYNRMTHTLPPCPLSQSLQLHYPHMVLLEISGDLQQKMAVSGSIKCEALKARIQTRTSSTKAIYLMVRKGLRTKVAPSSSTIRELHELFQDDDGYLRIYVREEAAF